MNYINCLAYGLNSLQTSISFTLYSLQGFRIFGDPGTRYRINKGEVKNIEQEPSFSVLHHLYDNPAEAFYQAYPNGWGHANPRPSDIKFPALVEIEYQANCKNAGFRGMASDLRGFLPPRLERWHLYFLNNTSITPRKDWAEAGMTSAGVSNWNTIKAGLKHVLLADQWSANSLGNAGYPYTRPTDWNLNGNHVLETFIGVALSYNLMATGATSHELRYLEDELGSAVRNGTPQNTLLDGYGQKEAKLDLGLLCRGLPYYPGDRYNAITRPILEKLNQVISAAPAPGAFISAGVFPEDDQAAKELLLKGFDVRNGNY